MPTLYRYKDPRKGDYYIKTSINGAFVTYHVEKDGVEFVAPLYKFDGVTLPAGLLDHLREQGWATTGASGTSDDHPWIVDAALIDRIVREGGTEPMGRPHLRMSHDEASDRWQLGISIPPLPMSWIDDAPPAEFDQLRAGNCRIASDGTWVQASRLANGRATLPVAVRTTGSYTLDRLGNWPASLEIRSLTWPVGALTAVTVFNPIHLGGERLKPPTLAAGDEIVVLCRPTDRAARSLAMLTRQYGGEVIAEGKLEQDRWPLFHIRLPESDDGLRRILQVVDGRPTQARWRLELLAPLPLSLEEDGLAQVEAGRSILVCAACRRRGHGQAEPRRRGQIVWVQRGIPSPAIPVELQPGEGKVMKLSSPGTGQWDLWLFGDRGAPARLPFEFVRGTRRDAPWTRPHSIRLSVTMNNTTLLFDGFDSADLDRPISLERAKLGRGDQGLAELAVCLPHDSCQATYRVDSGERTTRGMAVTGSLPNAGMAAILDGLRVNGAARLTLDADTFGRIGVVFVSEPNATNSSSVSQTASRRSAAALQTRVTRWAAVAGRRDRSEQLSMVSLESSQVPVRSDLAPLLRAVVRRFSGEE